MLFSIFSYLTTSRIERVQRRFVRYCPVFLKPYEGCLLYVKICKYLFVNYRPFFWAPPI